MKKSRGFGKSATSSKAVASIGLVALTLLLIPYMFEYENVTKLMSDTKKIERESPADENLVAHLELQWDERRRERQAAMSTSDRESFDIYEPEATCFDEERFGSEIRYHAYGDGPKFICGVNFIAKKAATAGGYHHGRDKNCLVYSVGSNNQVDFEKAAHKFLNGCEIHTFDPTLSKPFIGGEYATFHPWGLGEDGITSSFKNKTWVAKSFQTVMRELGHTNRTIDIIKIDCEGCEYQVMPPLFELISAGKAKVDQILIELHLRGKKGELLKEFFSGADKAKMRIFHKERNGWGCSGTKCAEYALASETFLRKANSFAIHPSGS